MRYGLTAVTPCKWRQSRHQYVPQHSRHVTLYTDYLDQLNVKVDTCSHGYVSFSRVVMLILFLCWLIIVLICCYGNGFTLPGNGNTVDSPALPPTNGITRFQLRGLYILAVRDLQRSLDALPWKGELTSWHDVITPRDVIKPRDVITPRDFTAHVNTWIESTANELWVWLCV